MFHGRQLSQRSQNASRGRNDPVRREQKETQNKRENDMQNKAERKKE
jgi:hypothetical protein